VTDSQPNREPEVVARQYQQVRAEMTRRPADHPHSTNLSRPTILQRQKEAGFPEAASLLPGLNNQGRNLETLRRRNEERIAREPSLTDRPTTKTR
jgi:hypothetical protein